MGAPANPSAFPCNSDTTRSLTQHGMTLRDWFAGQVIAGLGGAWARDGMSPEDLAVAAYDLADAMLAERAKEGAE